jgi:hypothetical protein
MIEHEALKIILKVGSEKLTRIRALVANNCWLDTECNDLEQALNTLYRMMLEREAVIVKAEMEEKANTIDAFSFWDNAEDAIYDAA